MNKYSYNGIVCNQKNTEKSVTPKAGFLLKINKIGKHLGRLIRKRKDTNDQYPE